MWEAIEIGLDVVLIALNLTVIGLILKKKK